MPAVRTTAMVADESAITAFLEARHSQPHDLLGHHVGPGGLTVTAYRPLAASVRARLQDGTILDLPHVRGGIWSGTTDVANTSQDYRLLVSYGDGVEHEQDDPYRFAPTLGEVDRHLFNEGRHEQLWKVLGAHVRRYEGPLGKVEGVAFAVWAPNATAVHVVGDFNGWDRLSHPMRMLAPSGVWELFVPDAHAGMNYQFAIRGQDTIVRLKADPMARFSEVAPKQASVVYESTYEWNDSEWMTTRATDNPHNGPMSVYEVHVGSWRQGQGYRDLAEHLVNYVKDLGFTHVEFMPVMEHPYVPSWGYHVTGYYAVSSRWGTVDDFKLLVDYLHCNGIGVILDWVPGHFATDSWALGQFDGTHLYEHGDPRKGWHQEWGSYVFDFGRPEVRNFLVANASYWLEEFHIDGLRVDGVASMLYLDYSRQPGEWIPNAYGGRENLDAVALLQEANATAYKRVPGVVTIAEESTAWGGVSKPTEFGGLGFGFKWNMGWMNDAVRYLGLDPVYRQYHHNYLTFALMYAYTENYVLPISHDEVVHGKGSLMRKVRGNRDEQIATVRAFLAYMWTHPGKQLIFMGSEFAQESEWSDGRSLDWWLLDQPLHYRVHALVRDMNAIYRSHPALWELDHSPAGFWWLNADDAGRNTFSYLRIGSGDPHTDAPVLACIVNLSGSTHEPYRIGVPRSGGWRVILDTAGYHPDAPSSTGVVIQADDGGWDGQPYAVNVTVPRLSTVWLVPDTDD
ncbi:MAG: 1,4-alpha-glucan branching protein GlgB [Dermatophilaceae bacterium]